MTTDPDSILHKRDEIEQAVSKAVATLLDRYEPPRTDGPELCAALAKAQGKIQHAAQDKTNPHYGNRYATLADVWDACREPLSANGLSVVQLPSIVHGQSGAVVKVVTRLQHATGQYLATTLTMPLSKTDAQGVGAAITYARRYSLAAIVGVAPDDDDDGNAAAGKGQASAGQQRRQQPQRQRRDEPPRGTQRTTTSSGKGTGGKAGNGKPAKFAEGTPEHEAHKQLVQTGKRYLAACKAAGVRPELYKVCGAAIGDGEIWDPKATYTVEQYRHAVRLVGDRIDEIEGPGDQSQAEGDPEICAHCGKTLPDHDDDCPGRVDGPPE